VEAGTYGAAVNRLAFYSAKRGPELRFQRHEGEGGAEAGGCGPGKRREWAARNVFNSGGGASETWPGTQAESNKWALKVSGRHQDGHVARRYGFGSMVPLESFYHRYVKCNVPSTR
jgi:hypothetical protein